MATVPKSLFIESLLHISVWLFVVNTISPSKGRPWRYGFYYQQ